MAARGPIPKRASLRRRRNKPKVPLLAAVSAGAGPWPKPDPKWHPIVTGLYASLQESGQSQFCEASDVAYAVFTAEVTNRLLNGAGTRSGQGISGQTLAAVNVMWSNLLATEADRRRLRVELRRDVPEEPPSVRIMQRYRAQLGTVN